MDYPSLFPFIEEVCTICTELAHTNWHDNQAGNLSLLLHRSEIETSTMSSTPHEASEWNYIDEAVPELDGYYVLISRSGQRLKHVIREPANALALLRIGKNGTAWQCVWGLEKGGKPSSELMVHLLSHRERLVKRGSSRALLHCHPPYAIATSFCLPNSTQALNNLLWSSHPEAIAIFPEGVGFLQLMLPGGLYLAQKTAQALAEHNLVLWATHGVIAAADDFDTCIGYIEVLEKVLMIYTMAKAISAYAAQNPTSISRNPLVFAPLTQTNIQQLASHFKVSPTWTFKEPPK